MKSARDTTGTADGRTRDRVVRRLVEVGPTTAAALGEHLGLSPAAVRRHLDAMLADGSLSVREARPSRRRGRGRPARLYVLTDAGRELAGPSGYADLALSALRHVAASGEDALGDFADARADELARRIRSELETTGTLDGADDDPVLARRRVEAVAAALSRDGYAATVSDAPSGTQLCQHHCPVAHVAAAFPQLCEAETAALSVVLGSHVQRLATIAHGDDACTTHIPAPPALSSGRTS